MQFQQMAFDSQLTCANTLVLMSQTEAEAVTVDGLGSQLQELKEYLTSSLGPCVSAVGKLSQQLSEHRE